MPDEQSDYETNTNHPHWAGNEILDALPGPRPRVWQVIMGVKQQIQTRNHHDDSNGIPSCRSQSGNKTDGKKQLPRLPFPKLRVLRKLAAKKLGFRTLLDVVPLDPSLVKGSHGLPANDEADRPILIGDGPEPPADLSQADVCRLVRAVFDR